MSKIDASHMAVAIWAAIVTSCWWYVGVSDNPEARGWILFAALVFTLGGLLVFIALGEWPK